MNTTILAVSKLVGQALVALLMQLLAGKTFRKLFLLPFEWFASKSKNKIEQNLVGQAEQDLGLDKDPNFGETNVTNSPQ